MTSSSLWAHAPFRRLLLWSGAGHVALAAVLLFSPSLRQEPSFSPAPVFVDVVAQVPQAAPPAPAPPKPKQVVKEEVVIPPEPKPEPPKPKPEPKKEEPKPEPKKEEPKKEEPKPKPPEEAKPKAPSPTPEQLLAKIRQNVEAREPTPGTDGNAATAGRFDPLMAAYQKRVQALLYQNWAGVRAFSGQRDLIVSFEVGVDAAGGVQRVRTLESSGNRHFDQNAEAAIWRSDPLPPPPRGAFTLTVRFDPEEVL